MQCTSSSDALILGAGPAGTSAAIQCAKAGLKVVLVERSKFPRDRPGETLHPGIETLLKQLGVSQQTLPADALRHQGVWTDWGSGLHFTSFGADEHEVWRGFQVWRADFDMALLHCAQDLGVKVQQPCSPLAPIIENERVVGVTTSGGSFRSAFVIDATGAQCWLSKKLKLQHTAYTPRLTAYYGYASGECIPCNDAPSIVADEDGWTWTARVRPQLYQWTRLLFNKDKLAESWRPEKFANLQPCRRPCAADVTWRVINQLAGRGYFLVGDAAAVIDPAASKGVLKAIMSGMMAGYLATQILNHIQLEGRAIDEYNRWFKSWVYHDMDKLKQFYATLPNHPIWHWRK